MPQQDVAGANLPKYAAGGSQTAFKAVKSFRSITHVTGWNDQRTLERSAKQGTHTCKQTGDFEHT